jgi:hypothetical protein
MVSKMVLTSRLNPTYFTMPILTALFPAGLAIVLDRYVKVIGLHAQMPDAPRK